MPGDKHLLKTVSVRLSGRRHGCRREQSHVLAKGSTLLAVTEGQDESHYCTECGLRFIAQARVALDNLEAALQRAR